MVWVENVFAKAQHLENAFALDTDDDPHRLYHLLAQITLNQRRELEQIFSAYFHIYFVKGGISMESEICQLLVVKKKKFISMALYRYHFCAALAYIIFY
jgi:hypothetical protein